MAEDPPTPPADVPDDLAQRLSECSPATLRAVSGYAEALAEHRERAERLAGDEGPDTTPDPDSRPEGVPAKASLTTKTINDNRYYYWQWREGDAVKSKYHGPVDGQT